jgi:hypothetical protein
MGGKLLDIFCDALIRVTVVTPAADIFVRQPIGQSRHRICSILVQVSRIDSPPKGDLLISVWASRRHLTAKSNRSREASRELAKARASQLFN